MIRSDADNQRENEMDAPVAPLSIETFRTWLESRPDNEHWELIGGVIMMMAPATRDHQRIASNLERLLNDALETHRTELTAYQRVGLNLASIAPDYDPEPDVLIVDANAPGDERYSDRFYLAAEIVSKSDRKTVESKRDVYKRHPDCRCVLVIEQYRVEVKISLLGVDGWSEHRLTALTDALVLEEFGLRCTLADLYRGTALHPRGKRGDLDDEIPF
jgi:Uma2 family endonuclease